MAEALPVARRIADGEGRAGRGQVVRVRCAHPRGGRRASKRQFPGPVGRRQHRSPPAEGRSAVTGNDADRMNFKVPTLRNVELTYPYFHDGEAATLEEAVDVMGRLQLGRKYSEAEIADIVAFLKALTGDQPTFVMPLLPPSSNDTPRPNPWE